MPTNQPRCDTCGCSDHDACGINGVPCTWIEENLCSTCASLEQLLASEAGRYWLGSLLFATHDKLAEVGPGESLPGYRPCLGQQVAAIPSPLRCEPEPPPVVVSPPQAELIRSIDHLMIAWQRGLPGLGDQIAAVCAQRDRLCRELGIEVGYQPTAAVENHQP